MTPRKPKRYSRRRETALLTWGDPETRANRVAGISSTDACDKRNASLKHTYADQTLRDEQSARMKAVWANRKGGWTLERAVESARRLNERAKELARGGGR